MFTKSSDRIPLNIIITSSSKYVCSYSPGMYMVNMSLILCASMSEVIIISSRDTIFDTGSPFFWCMFAVLYQWIKYLLWSYLTFFLSETLKTIGHIPFNLLISYLHQPSQMSSYNISPKYLNRGFRMYCYATITPIIC